MNKSRGLRLEVSEPVVQRLLQQHLLSVSDLRCLDGAAKQRLRAIALDNVRARLRRR